MIPINFLALVVAAVVSLFIGFLWHGPLFGKMWMRLNDIKEPSEDEMKGMKNAMFKSMGVALLSYFIMAFVLVHSIYYFVMATGAQNDSWVNIAFNAAFWNWLGFVAVTGLSGVLWEKKSWASYAFAQAHWLVVMLVTAGIISFWN